MNERGSRSAASLRRASEALHGMPLADPFLTKSLKDLDALIERVQAQEIAQVERDVLLHRRGRIKELRETLRSDHLKPVIRLAKRLLRAVTGEAESLRLP